MLFWCNVGDKDTRLPYCIEQAVKSIEIAEFFEVHMLSHQKFTNVPDFVKQVDANCVMPVRTFHALYESGKQHFPVQAGVGKSKHMAHSPVICLIADWIRFSYAGKFTKGQCDCVCVIDADTTWIRPWHDRGFMGFSFGSCKENPTSFENRDMLQRKLTNMRFYGRAPGDRLKISFPSQFVVGHPILATINAALLSMCPVDGQWNANITDWNYVMKMFLKGVNDHGLRDAFEDHELFSAMHWYWREKPMQRNVILYTYVRSCMGGCYVINIFYKRGP